MFRRSLHVVALLLSLVVIFFSLTSAHATVQAMEMSSPSPRSTIVPVIAKHGPMLPVSAIDTLAEPVLEEITPLPFSAFGPLITEWHRPARSLRVGIQAGHWQHEDAPAELSPLWGNTGAISPPYTEAGAVLIIAQKVQAILEQQGITVDLLPATVPPDYQADAFVAIHADGNADPRASGYKVGASGHDLSGRAPLLAAALAYMYGQTTGMPHDPNITLGMTGYYAFNYRLYQHSVDPYTPGALIETGFISSPKDRMLIVGNSDLAAQAIAKGILLFLSSAE